MCCSSRVEAASWLMSTSSLPFPSHPDPWPTTLLPSPSALVASKSLSFLPPPTKWINTCAASTCEWRQRCWRPSCARGRDGRAPWHRRAAPSLSARRAASGPAEQGCRHSGRWPEATAAAGDGCHRAVVAPGAQTPHALPLPLPLPAPSLTPPQWCGGADGGGV